MKRIALSDRTGWFDLDAIKTVYKEGSYLTGDVQFPISMATGSARSHEALFLTATGNFILHWWGYEIQGTQDGYRKISEGEAVCWIIMNGLEIPPELQATSESIRV